MRTIEVEAFIEIAYNIDIADYLWALHIYLTMKLEHGIVPCEYLIVVSLCHSWMQNATLGCKTVFLLVRTRSSLTHSYCCLPAEASYIVLLFAEVI